MKRTILSAALILLLLLIVCPAAFADVTYPDPAPLEVGQTLNHLAASVEPGSSVAVSAGSLPPGVALSLDQHEEATYVYLRGIPTSAGVYDAVVSINNETSFLCTVDVQPETPKLIVGPSVNCFLNDPVHVSVTATVSDGGTLSYQWYASDGSSHSSIVSGGVDSFYPPGTDYLGTTYYYCVVTNTNNGISVSVASPIVSVTVDEVRVTGLSVQTLPAKTDYYVGERLNTEGLALLVSYSDGRTETVTSGYQLYPTLLDKAGVQTIELSYANQFCRFEVNVQEEPERIDGIGVLTLPHRSSYVVGETLDPAGLSIRVYTNRGTRDVSEGLVCSPMFLNQEGGQVITVSYGDKTCTFTVTVESEELPDYLSLYQLPDKLNYRVGETLDVRGMVLYLISNHNNVTVVTDGYGVSPTRFDTAGQQTVTVSYAGFSASFKVNVNAAEAVSPSPSPLPSAAPSAAPAAETPAVSVTPAPTSFPVMPTPTPAPSHSIGSRRSFVGVVVAASGLALAVIGAYVFIMNRGGFDALEQKLEDLLRRNRRR